MKVINPLEYDIKVVHYRIKNSIFIKKSRSYVILINLGNFITQIHLNLSENFQTKSKNKISRGKEKLFKMKLVA
jgi:hypothetical protein